MMKECGAMLGLAIGDALGQPFEFQNYERIKNGDWYGEYQGGAACGVPLEPGQWTDDTKMAICLAQSLIDNEGFDQEHVGIQYIKWLNSGDLRGIGGQTMRSLTLLASGHSVEKAGQIMSGDRFESKDFCGNGTVMRVAPIGIFFKDDPAKMIKYAKDDAVITHDHKDAKDSSVFVAYVIATLLDGYDPNESVAEALAILEDGNVKNRCIEAVKLAEKSVDSETVADKLGADGCAHNTAATAVYCLLRHARDDFRTGVITSVSMGGDADTRGAVAGAMLGAHFGHGGIVKSAPELVDGLEAADYLIALDKVLSNMKEIK